MGATIELPGGYEQADHCVRWQAFNVSCHVLRRQALKFCVRGMDHWGCTVWVKKAVMLICVRI